MNMSHRMLRLVILLTAVCSVLGDSFAKKYAFTKVMTNCLSEDIYLEWSKQVFHAMKECYGEETVLPKHEAHEDKEEEEGGEEYGNQPLFVILNSEGQAQNIPFRFAFSQRQKREAMYDAPVLKKMVAKMKAKIGNFTCVMKKMQYVDEDFNIKFDYMKQEIKDFVINDELQADLMKGIDKCEDITQCLSSDKSGSPMPKKLKKMLAFLKCDKKTRFSICMKHDFMKHLDKFETSAIQMEDEGEEEVAEKLIHIMWGLEADDEFQLY
ncbi:uncharacterized protein LOC122265046 [Penaeus japonicus]|uniref:uncharacterized protein LOC122265046 n=1 Tax=Penaeus japonicus TaxID=27405 RepID=UPI001C7107BB|nr:uncharacterized protein LOC122265046 [Penaeus japonicus]